MRKLSGRKFAVHWILSLCREKFHTFAFDKSKIHLFTYIAIGTQNSFYKSVSQLIENSRKL